MSRESLSFEAEFFYDAVIAAYIGCPHVVKEFLALSHHAQKPAARMVVLAVAFEMFGKARDFVRQNRNLDAGRTRVFFMRPDLFNDFLFFFWGECHYRYFIIKRTLAQIRFRGRLCSFEQLKVSLPGDFRGSDIVEDDKDLYATVLRDHHGS